MKFVITFIYLLLLAAPAVWAQNVSRIEDYPNARAVKIVKIKAHISRVDHELLRADYAFMSAWSDEKIESWLSNNLNILARTQAQQSQANTPIEYSEFTPQPKGQNQTEAYVSGVYRPTGYGRALVVEVYDPKLKRTFYFDGKGLGAERPKGLPHSTGLASFGEANREITMSTLVDRALKHAGSKFSAVQSYFQFQYEFDMLEKTSGDHTDISRAGAVFRQNHLRPKKIILGYEDFLGGADPKTSLKVEKILRRYGITTAGSPFGSLPELSQHIDVTNVQIARDGLKLYDFGGYIIEKEFHRPLAEWDSLVEYLNKYPASADEFLGHVQKKKSSATSLILAKSGDRNFIQPDPELRASFEFFGYATTNVRSVRYDGPWIFAHDMDRSARVQNLKIIPREWVEGHHRAVLGHLNHLPSPRLCRMLF